MDLVRNIISNLYIYKNQNNDKLNLNNLGIKPLSNNKSLSNIETNEQSIAFTNNNNNKININNENEEEETFIENYQNKDNNHNNNNIYENVNTYQKEENNTTLRKNNSSNRLDNYNLKYIALKNNNFLKNEVNYVLKNKELIKEQENQMKEIKQKKENEALNLLLSYKTRKN